MAKVTTIVSKLEYFFGIGNKIFTTARKYDKKFHQERHTYNRAGYRVRSTTEEEPISERPTEQEEA